MVFITLLGKYRQTVLPMSTDMGVVVNRMFDEASLARSRRQLLLAISYLVRSSCLQNPVSCFYQWIAGRDDMAPIRLPTALSLSG